MFNSTKSGTSERGRLWRSRWAAAGAAIAVSLGAGGLLVAQAAPAPSGSTVVTVTPVRILDTRDPVNVGLSGPFVSAVSQKLKVSGSIPTTSGVKTVVPDGATGVLLNVTPVNATADGFIAIRPGDATGAPSTSSLNFTAGSILPNSVQVALPTSGANAGRIDITYDAYGAAGPTTDVLIDVVGYTADAGLEAITQRLDALEANQSFAVGTESINEVELAGTEFLTPANVLSLTVNAPADGNFSVIANTTARGGTGGQNARAVCQISTGDAIDVNLPLAVSTTQPERPTLGTNKVIPVTAGQSVTINFLCSAPAAGDNGTLVEYRSMLAIFAPQP